MKISFGLSIIAIIVGGLIVFGLNVNGGGMKETLYFGTALVCTGLVTLTLSEVFGKNDNEKK